MTQYLVLGLIGLFLTACATGPQRESSALRSLPPAWSWNIGAGDLLDPSSAGCRLGVYLDELTALGGPKRIRIVYTPETGPFQLQHWIPVIRAKGFRLNLVLTQWSGDKDLTRLNAWLTDGVQPIVDLVDGVQLANEPDGGPGYSGMEPREFARWHHSAAALVRRALPGVAIIGPDLYPRSIGYVADTRLYMDDPSLIVSLHVSGLSKGSTKSIYTQAQRLTGQSMPRVWVTEGRKRSAGFVGYHAGITPRIEQSYVYIWNCNMGGFDRSCEPETRRPEGGVVAQCGGGRE